MVAYNVAEYGTYSTVKYRTVDSVWHSMLWYPTEYGTYSAVRYRTVDGNGRVCHGTVRQIMVQFGMVGNGR